MLDQMKNAFVPGSDITKIDRYKWKLRDAPGELSSVHKSSLVIDPQYQRTESEEKIRALARDWSWLACGAIIAARRKGAGSYFVVDGQHRVAAAQRRSDITTLPCLIFDTADAKEEAAGFLAANTQRKPISGLAKFRALLTTESPAAVLVHRLIVSAGRTPSTATNSSTVRCLNLLMNYANYRPDLLQRVWPLIMQVCAGHPVHERVLQGLIYIEENLPDGQSLLDEPWRKRLLKVGYLELLNAANRFAAAYSKGGAKVWARGMVEVMNKGCRNLIVLDDASSQ